MIRSISFLLTLVLSVAGAVAESGATDSQEWWNLPYPQQFDPDSLKNPMDFVSVAGNRFVNERGEVVVFRGMSSSDPDKLEKNGYWTQEYFAEAAAWGANVLRITVHPIAWRARGRDGYLQLLDQAVRWANEFGLYLIIDWHSLGNLSQNVYQHPMYETNLAETRQFWRAVAHRYQGVSTVAFYELFNEPTDSDGQFGRLEWPEWKAINESLIDLIYSYDRQVVFLVAGFDWAYDLSEARGALIERPGVAYVAHPYPQKAEEPLEQSWDEKFGFITGHAPLVVTEMGWMKAGERGAHFPAINNDGSYGPKIVDYLENKGASWVAWVFDPDWTPNLIADWRYVPTEQGKFFKAQMLELNR